MSTAKSVTELILEQGYVIVQANDLAALDHVRAAIVTQARQEQAKLGPEVNRSDDDWMNDFHKLDIHGPMLNTFRMGLMSAFNSKVDVGQLIFDAFSDVLTALVGTDVAVQRSVNLVIQQPHDSDVAPAHRDSPPNSPFEVVAWVPLVDCYGTKGMSVLDCTASEVAVSRMKAGDFNGFQTACSELGQPIEVPYGHALLFWAGLVHDIPINVENATRWALNLRYKNAFSPYGTKGIPDYFRILKLSPLATLGMKAEHQRLGGKL